MLTEPPNKKPGQLAKQFYINFKQNRKVGDVSNDAAIVVDLKRGTAR